MAPSGEAVPGAGAGVSVPGAGDSVSGTGVEDPAGVGLCVGVSVGVIRISSISADGEGYTIPTFRLTFALPSSLTASRCV